MQHFERHHGWLNEDTEWARHQMCRVDQENGDCSAVITLATQGIENAHALMGENSELEVRCLDVRGDGYRYMGDVTAADQAGPDRVLARLNGKI